MPKIEQQRDSAKVILITGSTGGIGAALAKAAGVEGHQIALNYRSDADSAKALASEINDGPGAAVAFQGDVSAPDEAERLVADTLGHFGRVDCLINNAGIGQVMALDELDLESFEKTIRTNLTSAFIMSQAVWPHMKQTGGRLIFMSSAAARSGGGLSAAYAASKGGIESLMHAYATALRPLRITANAVAPALVESRMARLMDVGPIENLPMGRLGRPEELWPAVRMILETEYLTGQTIHIDAGRYMT